VEDQIIEKIQSFNPSESNGEKDDIKQKLKIKRRILFCNFRIQ